MGKKELLAMWEKLGRTQEATFKAVALIPVGRLDWKPVPQVRTVKELVRHVFAWEKLYARAARTGALTQQDAEKEESTPFKDNRELIAYGRKVHKETTALVKKLTERDLRKRVKFFFGSELSAGECIERIYDEHWHHRGQLYVYLRLLGVKPPYLYGID